MIFIHSESLDIQAVIAGCSSKISVGNLSKKLDRLSVRYKFKDLNNVISQRNCFTDSWFTFIQWLYQLKFDCGLTNIVFVHHDSLADRRIHFQGTNSKCSLYCVCNCTPANNRTINKTFMSGMQESWNYDFSFLWVVNL